jgi:hypothetical protein
MARGMCGQEKENQHGLMRQAPIHADEFVARLSALPGPGVARAIGGVETFGRGTNGMLRWSIRKSNEGEVLCRIYRELTTEQWFVAGYL